MIQLNPMDGTKAAGLWAALAVATAAPTAAAQWESATVGGVDARVYTPASMSPVGEGRALMIVLHGCSQSADQLQLHGNFEPAADALGFVVAIPNVPLGGVIAGCWDYYGPDHTRQDPHHAAVIAMTEALRDDAARAIDPAQMYMVGFSSGGGQALILACLAPELFAGVGVAAAPGLGTTVTEIPQVGTTAQEATSLCTQFAGAGAADLASQLGVALSDSADATVAQGYAAVNAEMFGAVMSDGLDAMSSSALDVASLDGASPAGSGTIYADNLGPRVVHIQSMGVGHAWPSGSGEMVGALAFVSGTGINYSMYLAEFFTANNVRVDGDWMPSDDGGGSDGGDGESDGGGSDAGADAGDGSNDTGEDDGGLPGSDDPERVEPSGCQCGNEGPGVPPAWALLVLVLPVLLRRRPE